MASKDIVVRNMPFPTAGPTAGAAVYIGDLDPATVNLTVGGTFVATAKFEGSLDGTNYFPIGAAGTSGTAIQVNMTTASPAMAAAVWVRANANAFTSSASGVATVVGYPKAL